MAITDQGLCGRLYISLMMEFGTRRSTLELGIGDRTARESRCASPISEQFTTIGADRTGSPKVPPTGSPKVGRATSPKGPLT
jgi:hypothetical protein